jgi:hypothetical protein
MSPDKENPQWCRRYSGKFTFPDVTPEGQDSPAIETAWYWQGSHADTKERHLTSF